MHVLYSIDQPIDEHWCTWSDTFDKLLRLVCSVTGNKYRG